MVQRQLGGDRSAAGVSRDVGLADPEVVEQGRGVGRVVGDADRSWSAGAADPATLVVADQLVTVGEDRFCQQRQEAVCEHRADEQHRLSRTHELVLQLHAVDRCAFHGSS